MISNRAAPRHTVHLLKIWDTQPISHIDTLMGQLISLSNNEVTKSRKIASNGVIDNGYQSKKLIEEYCDESQDS